MRKRRNLLLLSLQTKSQPRSLLLKKNLLVIMTMRVKMRKQKRSQQLLQLKPRKMNLLQMIVTAMKMKLRNLLQRKRNLRMNRREQVLSLVVVDGVVLQEIEKATLDLETGIVNFQSVETNKTLAGEMSVKRVVNQKHTLLLMLLLLLQAVVVDGVVEEDSEEIVRVASEIEKATPDLETGIVNFQSVETNKTLVGEMSVKRVVNQKQSAH